VPDTFWQLPEVIRSNHLYELDGQVLLLGVGHDVDTMLRLAELLVGVLYRVMKYCSLLQDGRPVRIDYGKRRDD
jgi:aminoglycoside N3'-acetyltransferase